MEDIKIPIITYSIETILAEKFETISNRNITTKRAFDELELDGFINSVQGKGNFVAAQNKELIREEYLKRIELKLQEAVELSEIAGVSNDELVQIKSIMKV